jgi:hypothetical protein
MSVFTIRTLALLVLAALLGLTSCSGPSSARAGSPAFYWSAAKETYNAGDYLKTLDDLDRLIETKNDYTARAIPWSLMLTSGVAAGYIELADAYSSGARVKKNEAVVAFHRKASEYRNMANPLVLRFAQNINQLDQLPPGSVSLAFAPPKGNFAIPAVLAKISAGIQPSTEDAESALTLAIERNVLLSACLAAGAKDDTAKARQILGHASTITPRATFVNGLAQMLDFDSRLYARDRMDNTEKLGILRKRAEILRNDAARSASAMVVSVQSASR